MIFSFAASKASFINDNWELVERLIDFNVLDDDEHKGQEAAKAFVRSASKRGGLNKISPPPPVTFPVIHRLGLLCEANLSPCCLL